MGKSGVENCWMNTKNVRMNNLPDGDIKHVCKKSEAIGKENMAHIFDFSGKPNMDSS